MPLGQAGSREVRHRSLASLQALGGDPVGESWGRATLTVVVVALLLTTEIYCSYRCSEAAGELVMCITAPPLPPVGEAEVRFSSLRRLQHASQGRLDPVAETVICVVTV